MDSFDRFDQDAHAFIERVKDTCPGTAHSTLVLMNTNSLAAAWLKGEENQWKRAHERQFFAGQLPTPSIGRGYTPFSFGELVSDQTSNLAVAVCQPLFYSPAYRREFSLSTANMPGFGNHGESVFSLYHEVGHYLQNQMGLHTAYSQIIRENQDEARSDSFAVAWAASQGMDGEECARNITCYRACTMSYRLSSRYCTWLPLEEAARVGKRMRGETNPWVVMNEVDQIVCQNGYNQKFLEIAEGKSPGELKEVLPEFAMDIQRFQKQAFPWNGQQEQEWWKKLRAENPARKSMLLRMPAALVLTGWLREKNAPARKDVVNLLAPFLGRVPSSTLDCATWFNTLEIDSSPFNNFFKESLKKFAQKPIEPVISQTLIARMPDQIVPGAHILLDIRDRFLTHSEQIQISDWMREKPLGALGVLASNQSDGEWRGHLLRVQADKPWLPLTVHTSEHSVDYKKFQASTRAIKNFPSKKYDRSA